MRGARPDIKEGDAVQLEELPPAPRIVPAELHDEWDIIVADLKARGHLTAAVLGVVETYLLARFNVRQASDSIARRGMLVSSRSSTAPKANPATGLLGKSQETVTRLAAELGLTPLSRSRKTLQPPKDEGSGLDGWA
jgi:P27 family predicted phage terminase small subunit